MHESWNDYVKPKYGEKTELCYMDIDGFVAYIKQKIFTQTLPKMLKQDFILQIMS